ncbi:MAG: PilZ domain-containing protein [Rhodocyclaceae bacterium]|nr:PilZ domain-containing protein [Rhodocyclaceae bacterium]MDP1957987.1 PilZ domain-containing protein [Rhodocyclaceae bacterium]
MTIQNDRRQFWRAHFRSPVQLATAERVIEAGLCDISLKGALIEMPAEWSGRLGDRFQLKLDLAAQASIGMSATVSHIEGCRVGLRCEDIDLDSVTHLRRLVELNSGDPALLDRELSALLREAG